MTAATKTPETPFATTPLSPVLGAEVVGYDVRDLKDPRDVEALKLCVRDAQVLCFRDQNLTAAEMVTFLRTIGEPQYHVMRKFLMPETPELYVLSNVKEDGKPVGNAYEGMGWHTDLKGQDKRTAFTVLYGREIPEQGGATCFASMYRAYEALPAEKRKELDGLQFVYTYETQYNNRLKMLAEKGITDHSYPTELRPEQVEYAKRRHINPIVDVNPYNGRKWLHMATGGCAGIVGKENEEGVQFVLDLSDWATSAPFRYDHAWRKNDLLIWDNYGLFHVAGEYDKTKYRRLIWRGSIADER